MVTNILIYVIIIIVISTLVIMNLYTSVGGGHIPYVQQTKQQNTIYNTKPYGWSLNDHTTNNQTSNSCEANDQITVNQHNIKATRDQIINKQVTSRQCINDTSLNNYSKEQQEQRQESMEQKEEGTITVVKQRKYDQYLQSNNKNVLLIEWEIMGRELVHPDFPRAPINFRNPSNKGEEIMKAALHHMFPNHNWRKVRPAWLINSVTGARLEIDAYCEELEIGVEYNGIQHYVYDDEHKKNPWCKNFTDFEKQIWRDSVKKKTCKDRGITLLIVPYWVPKPNIAIYIFCCFCDIIPL